MKPILTVVNAGGHLTQALCVMKVIDKFHLVTSKAVEMDVGAESVTIIKGTQFNPLIHLKNIWVAFTIVRRIKPQAVFSTGGPICIPFAIVARLLGIRFIYLDTLSRVQELSNTAKFLHKYKLATELYCQWASVAEQYQGVKFHGQTFNICNHRNESL